jgi:hypothetical protein
MKLIEKLDQMPKKDVPLLYLKIKRNLKKLEKITVKNGSKTLIKLLPKVIKLLWMKKLHGLEKVLLKKMKKKIDHLKKPLKIVY